LLETVDNGAALVGGDQMWYLGGWPDQEMWDRLIVMAADKAGLSITALPSGLRLRNAGRYRFAFNYSAHSVEWDGQTFEACSVALWAGIKRIW
jgi:beta-galactosidase